MKNILIFLALISSIAFVGCQKDDNSDRLCKHSWRLTSLVFEGTSVDIFPSQPTYLQDNIYNFNCDGSYTITEGATRANASEPDISEVGIWSINDATNQFTMVNSANVAFAGAVQEISDQTFIVNILIPTTSQLLIQTYVKN